MKKTKNEKPDFSKMTVMQRMSFFEKAYIINPRHTRVLERVDHCREYSKIASEPECLLIVGESGTGKSTLLERFAQDFPRTVVNGTTHVPVMATCIPSKPTVKGLVSHLLKVLGDPCWEKGTEIRQTERYYELVKECCVELTILDEFQHFFELHSDYMIRYVSDWLKNLITETKKPIVLAGTPECIGVLAGNKPLRRRFSARETLAPLSWGTGKEDSEFRMFLQCLEEALPLKEPSNLTDVNIAFRCYRASENGIIGYLMKIVRRATFLTLEEKREWITIDDLANGYDDEIATDEPGANNPFRVDIEHLNIPSPSKDSGPKGTNCRVRRKEFHPRASDLLQKRA